ncbi:MAG: hypothetical protein C4297_06030 [Gemmataceae bacterium]
MAEARATADSATFRDRRRLRGPHLTREAALWLASASLLLLLGWLRSINLVALLACMLLIYAAGDFLAAGLRRRLKYVQVARTVYGPVFAGQPFAVHVRVENTSQRLIPGVTILDHGVHHRLTIGVPTLRARAPATFAFTVSIPERGRYLWPAIRVRSGYPLGLFVRECILQKQQKTLVLPRLGGLDRHQFKRRLLHPPRWGQPLVRPLLRRLWGTQGEFHGLREFRPGDSPKWIHWRTTARAGQLMVREFEDPPQENLVLLLEPWLPASAAELRRSMQRVRQQNQQLLEWLEAIGSVDGQARQAKAEALARKEAQFARPLQTLELAISMAATICWYWCREVTAQIVLGIIGDPQGLIQVEASAAAAYPLLERLAAVEGTPRFDHLDQWLTQVHQPDLPFGPVVLISPRASPLCQTISQTLRRPVLAINVGQPGWEDFFEGPTGLSVDEQNHTAKSTRAMHPSASVPVPVV